MFSIIGDRYVVTEPLGGGETGEVWRARDRGADREVAVKLVHAHLASDARLVERFLRARQVLAGLWHPAIARLLDVIVTDGGLALVTDLGSGFSLERRLAMGPLTPDEAAMIGSAMAGALATAHRVGVVHGDIKPSNVLLDPVQLTDFSVGLFVRAGRHRPESSPYRAPDVIEGTVPGPSSDVYSLGVLLCEMVTGTATAWELKRSGSEELAQVVDDCVRRDPGRRPTAEQVHERLLALFDEPPPPPPPLPRKKPPLVPLAALAVAGLLLITAVAFWPRGSTPDTPPPQPSTTGQNLAAPTLPTAATAASQQGGQAFVEHWFAMLSHVTRTGEVAAMRELTSDSCAQCGTGLQAIGAVHAAGGTVVGGGYSVRRVATSTLWTPERPVYDVTVDRTARSRLDSAGVARDTLPGLSFVNCVLVLERVADRWRLLEITTPNCIA